MTSSWHLQFTLLKTHIFPENWWLEDDISFWRFTADECWIDVTDVTDQLYILQFLESFFKHDIRDWGLPKPWFSVSTYFDFHEGNSIKLHGIQAKSNHMHTCMHDQYNPSFFRREKPAFLLSKKPKLAMSYICPGLQVAKMSYENKLTSNLDPSSAIKWDPFWLGDETWFFKICGEKIWKFSLIIVDN